MFSTCPTVLNASMLYSSANWCFLWTLLKMKVYSDWPIWSLMLRLSRWSSSRLSRSRRSKFLLGPDVPVVIASHSDQPGYIAWPDRSRYDVLNLWSEVIRFLFAKTYNQSRCLLKRLELWRALPVRRRRTIVALCIPACRRHHPVRPLRRLLWLHRHPRRLSVF